MSVGTAPSLGAAFRDACCVRWLVGARVVSGDPSWLSAAGGGRSCGQGTFLPALCTTIERQCPPAGEQVDDGGSGAGFPPVSLASVWLVWGHGFSCGNPAGVPDFGVLLPRSKREEDAEPQREAEGLGWRGREGSTSKTSPRPGG